MHYFSTRGESPPQNFSQILLSGSAPDGGLYMPEHWPQLGMNEIAALKDRPFHEVAFMLLRLFTAGSSADDVLGIACVKAYARFRDSQVCPLRQVGEGVHLLELFHGPTFAFKDIAMQLLAQLIGPELQKNNSAATIICATSGDTGAAAAGAFGDVPNVQVAVLFPKGRISEMQQRQMTATNAANILPIAIEGNFDDAQAIVKDLFADAAFVQQHHLTAVNSINWARIAAQVTYYFTSALQLGAPEKEISFCVPTGNFGDVFAGYVALKMGLPIKRLVIATNQNDILCRALQTGHYAIEPVEATTSPSMDIQVSSNFERLLFEASGRDAKLVLHMMDELKHNTQFHIPPAVLENIHAVFTAERADENEVAQKIRSEFLRSGQFIDPHTAVALVAAEKTYRPGETMVVLSTAHPAKFPEAVTAACGQAPPSPPEFHDLLRREESFATLPARTARVHDYLQSQLSIRGV